MTSPLDTDGKLAERERDYTNFLPAGQGLARAKNLHLKVVKYPIHRASRGFLGPRAKQLAPECGLAPYMSQCSHSGMLANLFSMLIFLKEAILGQFQISRMDCLSKLPTTWSPSMSLQQIVTSPFQ